MPRIGFISDPHIPEALTGYYPKSVVDACKDAVTYLMETLECDFIVFGGDQVSERYIGTGETMSDWEKNIKPEDVDYFWDMLADLGWKDYVYAIPGNHECPLWIWFWRSLRKAKERQVRVPQAIELDGVTVILLNTNPAGFAKRHAHLWEIGAGRPWVSYKDLLWLDDVLSSAKDADNIVIILHHAPLYFLENADINAVKSMNGAYTGNAGNKNLYWVCLNHRRIHNVLSTYAPIITLCGHIWPNTEGYYSLDNVYYCYKKHFATKDGPTTFAYIDIDTATKTVKVVTVDANTSDETVILEITV